MASLQKAHLSGYPVPTGSRPLGYPGPRGCGGPRSGLVARLWSSQNQSSRPQFCRSSRAQREENCPQPAGKQLKISFSHKTKGLHLSAKLTWAPKSSTKAKRELLGKLLWHHCKLLSSSALAFVPAKSVPSSGQRRNSRKHLRSYFPGIFFFFFWFVFFYSSGAQIRLLERTICHTGVSKTLLSFVINVLTSCLLKNSEVSNTWRSCFKRRR